MIRVTTVFLCLLLAAAAAGRYRAEEAVRNIRMELRQLETSKLDEQRQIQMLRAEVAYLENPERLDKIAKAKTQLRPSETSQILTAEEFLASFGDHDVAAEPADTPINNDVILHALAMANVAPSSE